MRTIKKRRYVFALLITSFIFVFGLMFGIVMETQRVDFIQQKSEEQRLDYRGLQFQYQFIDLLGEENNCPFMEKALNKNLESLEETRIKLTNYNEDAKLSKDEFEYLYRDYVLSQLGYWLLSKKSRDLCDTEVATILYFFSNEKICPECSEQAFILTYLKKRFGDKLLNFALNAELETEKSLDLLKHTYSINTFPTLIIEGKKFEGLTSKDNILLEICKFYNSSVLDCKNIN
ncbi:MAG: hypothetical protein ABIC91_09105 [Nanoarchaeota archaeon]|nr:hypothetical protein [Nanoarchaeota archaeon]MBU1029991.1 hypothetical protein [Nanoarchaeota archaeon]